MRLKCSTAIAAFWPSVNGAGGNTSSAEAPPSVAILAMRAASRRPSAQMPLTIGSLAPISSCGDVEHALLLVERAGCHLGRVRVDGDGREALGRGHVAQVLAEARLVDRQVVVERQEDGRNDAVRDVALVAGHVAISLVQVRTQARRRFALLCLKTRLEARPNPGRNHATSTSTIPAAGRRRGRRSRPLPRRGGAQAFPVAPHHHGGAGAGRRRARHQCAARRRGHVDGARPAGGDRERHRRRGLDRHRARRARRARRLHHPLRRQRHARAQSGGAQSQLRRGQRISSRSR